MGTYDQDEAPVTRDCSGEYKEGFQCRNNYGEEEYNCNGGGEGKDCRVKGEEEICG